LSRLLSLDLITDDDPWCPAVGLDGTPLVSPPRPEDPLEKALLSGMDKLSPKDQELMYALYWDGKSHREVADELGVVHRTIQYRRDRILKKLRKELDDTQGQVPACSSATR